MTAKEFKEITGEQPIDFFGGDWENELLKWNTDDLFCQANNCGNPINPGEKVCADSH